MKRLPAGRHLMDRARRARAAMLRRRWQQATVLGSVAAVASLMLPAAAGNAAARDPQPDLSSLVAQANQLAHQIDVLSEQYDGLQIQLTQARNEAKIAQASYLQDASRLGAGRAAVGQLAAESYMNGGLASSLEILTSSDAQTLMSRAAIMQQIQQENGDRVAQLSAAETAARRAHETALQQTRTVTSLVSAMAAKKNVIEGKVRILNSAAFAQAMSIFDQTGQYPNVNIPTANTVGAEALRYALTQRGKPYVWGAAGPGSYDCSGLVMWAYAQVGISLPHYTGSQWTMGEHVSRSQLEPGDLVFFFADISHVGIYLGNGLMVDAPSTGQVVQVQPVFWGSYVGAVRIVA